MKPKTPKTPDQRTVTVGSKCLESMWAAIAAKNVEETPPPGYMNAREYADKFDLPLTTARLQLVRLANAGQMTMKVLRRRVNRRLHEVTYYLPVR